MHDKNGGSKVIFLKTLTLWFCQKIVRGAFFGQKSPFFSKIVILKNRNFKNCNFRVLRGIFWGVSMKQNLLKIKKYHKRWPFFLDLSIFRVKKRKKRISHKSRGARIYTRYLFLRVLRGIFQGVCFYAKKPLHFRVGKKF